MVECHLEENAADCACTYTSCSTRGKCCECLKKHWRNGELPGCLFPADVERTYDRSLERFIATYQNR